MPGEVTVRSIDIRITANTADAIAKIEELKQSLAGLEGTASRSISGFNDMGEGLDCVGSSAKSASKNIDKANKSSMNMMSTVKRILLYRLIREALMAITNLFTGGTKKFKEFVTAVKDSRLSEMFTSLSYDVEILKLSIGSMSGEFLDMENENIGGIAGTLMGLNTAISKLNATMNGSDYYYQVNEEGVRKYAKALNEAKRAVMGFDEINKLSNAETSTEGLYDKTYLTGVSKVISDINKWFNSSEAGKWITTDSIGEFFTRLHNLFNSSDIWKWLTSNTIGDFFTKIQKLLDGELFNIEDSGIDFFKPFRELASFFKKDEEWNGIEKDIKKPFSGLEEFFTNIGTVVLKPFRDIAELFSKKDDGSSSDIESAMTDGMTNAISGLNTMLSVTPIKPVVEMPDVVSDFSEKIDAIIKSAASITIKIGVGFNDFVTELKTLLGKVAAVLIATPLKILFKLGLFKKGDSDTTNIGDIYSALDGISTSMSGTGIVGGSRGGGGMFYKKLDAYANGGFPSAGSMFIAGEAGPEIVGSINGRTGVASGEEVTGIKTAVYAIGEAIVAAINGKDMNAVVRLDDGSIYKASQRGAKRVGNSLISFA